MSFLSIEERKGGGIFPKAMISPLREISVPLRRSGMLAFDTMGVIGKSCPPSQMWLGNEYHVAPRSFNFIFI